MCIHIVVVYLIKKAIEKEIFASALLVSLVVCRATMSIAFTKKKRKKNRRALKKVVIFSEMVLKGSNFNNANVNIMLDYTYNSFKCKTKTPYYQIASLDCIHKTLSSTKFSA